MAEATADVRELDRVVLRDARTDRAGTRVPAGSVGTVVAVLAGGPAVMVEVTRPVAAIVTVPTALIERLPESAA